MLRATAASLIRPSRSAITNTKATDKYFATELDVDNPLLLRDTCANFMRAAREDAAERGVGVSDYLTAAYHARSAFLAMGALYNLSRGS